MLRCLCHVKELAVKVFQGLLVMISYDLIDFHKIDVHKSSKGSWLVFPVISQGNGRNDTFPYQRCYTSLTRAHG